MRNVAQQIPNRRCLANPAQTRNNGSLPFGKMSH